MIATNVSTDATARRTTKDLAAYQFCPDGATHGQRGGGRAVGGDCRGSKGGGREGGSSGAGEGEDRGGSVSPTQLVHVVSGLSKDFPMAALRVGCLVSANADLRAAVQALTRFCGVSGDTAQLVATMLRDNAERATMCSPSFGP